MNGHRWRWRIVAQLAAALAVALPSAPARAAQDWLPPVVEIPAGPFIAGSDRKERELAYRLDERAYGEPITRRQRWYEQERARGKASTKAYAITLTPITNRQYAAFVAETAHRVPEVDPATWKSYGLMHPYERTRRFAWQDGKPPAGREDHPVVLVSRLDALAYAECVLDGAGQVYEWTATLGAPGRAIVKGGSWDDKGCGVCRPAARHARPVELKHILIGFRLVREG